MVIVVQLVRTPDCGSGGRGFESRLSPFFRKPWFMPGLFCYMAYKVYILYSETLNQFYKGQTNNISTRIKRHNSGSESSTRLGVPWVLLWSVSKPSRSEALKFERKLKKSVERAIDRINV